MYVKHYDEQLLTMLVIKNVVFLFKTRLNTVKTVYNIIV